MNIQFPSHEEIQAAFKGGEADVVALFDKVGQQIVELAEQLAKQAEIIKELQAKAAKNSRNSGKPPSSDGYGKANKTESLRKKGERSNGGQPGHAGSTLNAVENPDHTETHDPAQCKSCHTSLEDVEVSGLEERQVFDIPAIRIEVTAHRATVKRCPCCGTENVGDFPETVTQSVQYGHDVKTWAAYFSNQHFIPVERTAQIFRDLLGHAPSEATLLKASQELERLIEPARQAVKAQLQQADVLHVDETGLRVQGKLHWLHSASTDKLTDYTVHGKRGKEAMTEAGILEDFTGKMVHDHWKVYFTFDQSEHALCNAHHLRELTYIEKQYGQPWAANMAALLLDIKEQVEKTAIDSDYLPIAQIQLYEQRYDTLVAQGLKDNPYSVADNKDGEAKKRGRPKQTPAYNLLIRFKDFKPETLAFMYDFRVPFDNNQAERDIRMVKVKQKVSGGFRTFEGAQRFGSIRGYISTVRKNSVCVFEAIKSAFSGSPFIPQPQACTAAVDWPE
jgi:transposase